LQYTGHYTITQQQSQEFAELSGDYNPLHVDPLYARRLQFGNTVIHGGPLHGKNGLDHAKMAQYRFYSLG